MYHSLPIDEVLRKMNTDLGGLKEEEVAKRLAEDGPNNLPEKKQLSKAAIFLRQLKSPLILILIAAGLATIILRDWADAIVIFLAVGLNSLIGFFQENKTNNILRELKKAVENKAIILRNGAKKEIISAGLVKGDIVILNAGERVPADIRLTETHSLKIDESPLTGEWIAAEKKAEEISLDAPLAETINMAYMGCLVEEGRGRGVVTATGIATEIGKISLLAGETREPETPFQKKIARLSWYLGLIILAFSCVFFILGALTGKSYLEMLLISVAAAVAAVPEGLPAAVTVIFAFGMSRILKAKGLVRDLSSAEILGSTSVICTDKTGTLTEARMQVARIFAGKKELLSDGRSYSEDISQEIFESHFLAVKIAVLASTAFIENPDEDLKEWVVRGKPTERALLLAGIQAGINKQELSNQEPKIDEIPFDSSYKFSASLHKAPGGRKNIYVLGSPEEILSRSARLQMDGHTKELTEEERKEIIHKINETTGKGERVLASAYKKVPAETDDLDFPMLSELVFSGLIAFKDPLRKDAKAAISSCIKAGMRPVIVTGDHKLTAKRVAEELGLPLDKEEMLDGGDLDNLDDNELEKIIRKIKIYARVEPRHKIRIVKAWQDLGEIVAMTGDGVNDAPALKAANIGIALNSGTELAKEASDLTLLDNGFHSIVSAVEQGRIIMDNVRKVITFLLIGGFTEITLIGLSTVFFLPLPILPSQILWKNLLESTPAGMALAFEPKEKGVMSRRPEPFGAPLLNSQMKFLIFIVGIGSNFILFGLYLWMLKNNFSLDLIRSVMFVGLAIDSFFFIYSCRNLRKNIWQYNPFSNIYVNLAVVLGLLLVMAALYLPGLQNLLKTSPLGFFEWSILIVFGFLNLVFVEIGKFFYVRQK